MPVSTPDKIDKTIEDFCKKINKNKNPVFINVAPTFEAKKNECFYNVRNHTEKNGGNIIYGWSIWIWKNVYIEAEHHAVWKTLNEELVDITPKEDNEKKILFLPDSESVYDYENNKRLNNIKVELVDDPLLRKFFSLSDKIFQLIESKSVGREIHLEQDTEKKLRELNEQSASALVNIYKKYLGPNDKCLCGSGKKIKKCCGIQKIKNLHLR